MRRAARSLTLAFSALLLPAVLAAQIHVELNGNLGYNTVTLREWRGGGAFDGKPLVYGSDVQVVFGRRYGRGLQIAVEGGYQHLMDYQLVVNGTATAFQSNAYRGALTTRFWFDEGAWFGEAGFGSYFFSGIRDPNLIGGAGTLIGIADRIAIPIRARASIMFSQGAVAVPVWLSTGISYRLSN